MNKANVVYVANDNYAVLAGVSMISLFENNKNVKNLSVYILSDCISDINLFNLQEIGYKYQRKVCIVDISNELSVFEEKGAGKYANETGGGYAASAKLLIPDLLLEEERVLYLDCDTLVVGDIEALLQIDMDNKPLGMAQDCIQNRYKKFISFEEKRDILIQVFCLLIFHGGKKINVWTECYGILSI